MTERVTPGSVRYLGAYHGTARMIYSPTSSLLSPVPPLLTPRATNPIPREAAYCDSEVQAHGQTTCMQTLCNSLCLSFLIC